MVIVMKLHR